MHIFGVALLAASSMLTDAAFVEPGEDAMREAFASDLSQGVESVLAYVARAGGEAALVRIRDARTDEFEIRSFRKTACRSSEERGDYVCDFAVVIDTIAGPIEKTITGRFYRGPCGLAYDDDA